MGQRDSTPLTVRAFRSVLEFAVFIAVINFIFGTSFGTPRPADKIIPAAAARQTLLVAPPQAAAAVKDEGLVPDMSKLGDRIPLTGKFDNTPVGMDNGVASGRGELSKATGAIKTDRVSGYFKKDGTYVAPYYRSKRKK